MMARFVPFVMASVLGFLLVLASAQPSSAQGSGSFSGPVQFGHADLTIVTAGGRNYHFTVEVAESPEQVTQGLMYRETMAEDAGMLFLLGHEEVATFWMRNTFLPLDMIFIGKDGRITNIHRNAAPGSSAVISSTAPVISVLEVNAGIAGRLGLQPGDKIKHPAFPP